MSTATLASASVPGALAFATRKCNVTVVGIVWIGSGSPVLHTIRTTLILPSGERARFVAKIRLMESAARRFEVEPQEVEVHDVTILEGHADEVQLLAGGAAA